jgi:hypothetical protein
MNFKLINLPDDDFVEFCYAKLLKRQADSNGKQYYIQKLKEGVSRIEIVEEFILSEEYSLYSFYENNPFIKFAPPGHFYSPLPKIEDINNYFDKQFHDTSSFKDNKVINLQSEKQIEMLNNFKKLYQDIPYKDYTQTSLRYPPINDQFGLSDAIVLYSIMRHFKPNKIIEVGSGYSSAAMLDTNELFLNNSVALTFIDPYPESLLKLLKKKDHNRCIIIQKPAQEVSTDDFLSLCQNDILFIDGSHVVKFGSDLFFLLFSIIPFLKAGVILHFHDIFWPFEYPKEWLLEGRAWNEIYFLRAFLAFNNNFEILFFNDFMRKNYFNLLQKIIPESIKYPGCSLWLKKCL